MKRAQFAPGIVMTLIAWLILAIVLLLLLLLKPDGKAADTPTSSVQGVVNEATLNAYLRMSSTLGADTVPFAEKIAYALFIKDGTLLKPETDAFLSQIGAYSRIEISESDKQLWEYGPFLRSGSKASTKITLPVGRIITITYVQSSAAEEDLADPIKNYQRLRTGGFSG